MTILPKRFRRPQRIDNVESWGEAVIPHHQYLSSGRPYPPDVTSFKKWKASYSRWREGYEGFLEIEASLDRRSKPLMKRTYEYFVALLLQSGQWHAGLLLMVKDVSETERDKCLGEIDLALASLRTRLTR